MDTPPSVAHEEDDFARRFHPGGKVPWRDAKPPEESGHSRVGQLRSCGYCGSMHPADLVAAIKAGAHGSWADQKYGWPYKAYFYGVPNPHANLPEVRSSANFDPGRADWIKEGTHWHEPPMPAPALTNGKFYSVHLKDATPEQREIIEQHLGVTFTFENGRVKWANQPNS